MKTVAIIYGWTGGSWSTRQFRGELQKAGFKVISNREKANIIIAHSAGCYRVPNKASAQFILLIHRFMWQLFYAIIRPGDIVISLRNHKSLNFLEKLKQKKIIIVRNSSDEYSSPEIGTRLAEYSNIKLVELPGFHDDYYTNPKPYIDLLLKEL
jgi:hypothetical protein